MNTTETEPETETETKPEINNDSEEIDNKIIKKRRGRQPTAPWRYDENGDLIIKETPTKKEYNFNYYYSKLYFIECAYCKKNILSKHMKRHNNSLYCKKIQDKIL